MLSVLLGKVKNNWQDKDRVLSLLGSTLRKSRRTHEEFVAEGLNQRKREEPCEIEMNHHA